MTRATRVAAWIAIGVVALAFAARAFRWEEAPLPHLVAVVPLLTAGIVVVVAVAAVRRMWVPAAAAALLAVVGGFWLAPAFTADGQGGEPVLVVATLNLRFGLGDADEVVRLVRDNDVDVLSLQELTPEAHEALLAAGLDDALPFSEAHPASSYVGTGLWSAYPLADAELVAGVEFNTVRATVNGPPGPVTVFAAHPPRPELRESERWLEQASKLSAILAAVDGPVVLAGDLNATRDQSPVRDLQAAGFVGAVDQAGAGFLPTYPNARPPLPIVAIDHIMARGSTLRAIAAHTESVTGADHRALIVTYAAD